jgi:hypothetical protein
MRERGGGRDIHTFQVSMTEKGFTSRRKSFSRDHDTARVSDHHRAIRVRWRARRQRKNGNRRDSPPSSSSSFLVVKGPRARRGRGWSESNCDTSDPLEPRSSHEDSNGKSKGGYDRAGEGELWRGTSFFVWGKGEKRSFFFFFFFVQETNRWGFDRDDGRATSDATSDATSALRPPRRTPRRPFGPPRRTPRRTLPPRHRPLFRIFRSQIFLEAPNLNLDLNLDLDLLNRLSILITPRPRDR